MLLAIVVCHTCDFMTVMPNDCIFLLRMFLQCYGPFFNVKIYVICVRVIDFSFFFSAPCDRSALFTHLENVLFRQRPSNGSQELRITLSVTHEYSVAVRIVI